ncbi:kinesin-like protein KIN-10B [Magnolia sinica]|uniref:kinesin-like protein KIN-10B n=1 Tax=Magnolia sinica TaxID=86752 RepID=UPI00265943B7|nr:kinesin-like protein KIN-10B [Magnolia sinica]
MSSGSPHPAESASINKSSYSFQKVVYSLNDNDSHIPYRQTKLTHMLQDSIGGTGQALMIACLEVETGLMDGGLGKIEVFPDRFVASTPEKDCLQKESSTNSQPRTDYSSRSHSRLWARRRLVSASAMLNLFSPWRSGSNSDKVELTVAELESLCSEIVAAEEREVHLKAQLS